MKNTKKADWNVISGTMRIFGNEVGAGKKKFTKFSTSIGSKNEDGEWSNFYFDLRFAGKAEKPEDDGEHWIEVKEAFLAVDEFTNKNKIRIVKPVIVITDSTVIE